MSGATVVHNPVFTLVTDVNLVNLSVVTKIRQTQSARQLLASAPLAKRHEYKRTLSAWSPGNYAERRNGLVSEQRSPNLVNRIEDMWAARGQQNRDENARNVSFVDWQRDRNDTPPLGLCNNHTCSQTDNAEKTSELPLTTLNPRGRDFSRSLGIIGFTQEGDIFVPRDKYSQRRELNCSSPVLGSKRGYTILKPTKGILLSDTWRKPKNFNVNWLTPPQTSPEEKFLMPRAPSPVLSKISQPRSDRSIMSVSWALPRYNKSSCISPPERRHTNKQPVGDITVGLRSYGPEMSTKWLVPDQTKYDVTQDWQNKMTFIKKGAAYSNNKLEL